MADRKNKLGLSVAIGAGVGAALGVALHHLPFWLSLGCVGGIVTGIILTRMTRSWFSHGILVVCVCCWYCCLWYGEPDAISNTVEYAKFSAVHITPWFAFTMKRATWSRRKSRRAISKNREFLLASHRSSH